MCVYKFLEIGGAVRRISRILFISPKENSGHSSEQSTRDFTASSRTRTGRAARSVPYLILLRGGLALRAAFQPRRWALAPPFHHHRPAVARRPAVSFSVALSMSGVCRRPPGLDNRVLCPAESGLSSSSRTRPVARTAPPKNVKDRGTGDGRSSCTRRVPSCARPSAPCSAAP